MDQKRLSLLNELVNEVTRDDSREEKVKELSTLLGIGYSEDPMQFLNNVLKGIHSKGSIHEQKNEQESGNEEPIA